MSLVEYEVYDLAYEWTAFNWTDYDVSLPEGVTGWSGYTINQATGQFVGTGTYSTVSGIWGGEIYQISNIDGGTNNLLAHYIFDGAGVMTGHLWYYKLQHGLAYPRRRGEYQRTITAASGAYPDDGPQGGSWYVRIGHDETTQINKPIPGEIVEDVYMVTWDSVDGYMPFPRYDLELSLDNGSTWKRIRTEHINRWTDYDFSTETPTSVARLRVRVVLDGTPGKWTAMDGVFTIRHDFAPSQPSSLSPNNTIVSRLDVIPMSWTHNHPNPQSKYDFRWSTDQQNWTTVNRTTTNQYYNAPEGLFPAGNIYWQVRTYSDIGMVSTWSNIAKFTAATPSDAPNILSSPTTSIARPTFQWSQSDQVAYQIIILDSVNNEVWNTGEVTSTVKARTSGVDLLNNSTYNFKIRTKTGLGLWTQYSEQIITVSYTPPARPTVSVEMIATGVKFNINNPEPTGTEPFHSHNDLYKRIGDKWVRIAKELQETYTDYSLASEEVAVYRVRAVSADNDTFSESEVIEVTGNKLKGIWIYDVDNPDSLINFKIDGGGRNESREVEHSFFKFAGRKKPVIQFGNQEDFMISANVAILRDDELKKKLDNLISKTVLYRDGRGRKVYGSIPHLTYNEIRSIGYEVAINVTEIDYTEEV